MKTRFTQSDNVYKLLSMPNIHETEINKLTYDSELESIYVIGNFGVKGHDVYTVGDRKCIFGGREFSLSTPEQTIDATNITPQGYWFFSGVMCLKQTLTVKKEKDKAYRIRISQLKAPAAKLYLNGVEIGLFAFAPFDLEVTHALIDGENEVQIILYSGNRNLLGPHHRVEGEPYAVAPYTFTDVHGWRDAADSEVWTDNYNFVEFGFVI